MRLCRLRLFCLGSASAPALAQYTFPVDTVIDNGPQANRINLVFLADGYLSTQQTQFISDVNATVTAFFNTRPLKDYRSFFNVYAVRSVSNETGAIHPDTAADCSFASPLVPVMNPTTLLS